MNTIQKNNFGLAGLSNYLDSDDGYDNLFNKFKERRAEKREDKKQKKADNKQRKDDRRGERQEKRELNNEKRRLKNDLKQTQIDERKSQVGLLNQQGQQPLPAIMPAAADNTTMIVAGVVGVLVIAGVGYFMLKKKPDTLALSRAA
jgi:hypothetical protein